MKTETGTADYLLLELTAEVVCAYVGNNSIQSSELPNLILQVQNQMESLKSGPVETIETVSDPKPAVNPRKSVFPDYLICLEDGKHFKALKRHLKSHFNLTPDEYRAKWGLPHDYPMVAANYAQKRSRLAKSFGLGRKPAQSTAVAALTIAKTARKPRAKTVSEN